MVGPKKQDFCPKINILKGNHFKIRGVRQKFGMILENKVVQKVRKKCFLNGLLLNDFFKNLSIFDIEN